MRLLFKGIHYNKRMQNWYNELHCLKVEILEYPIKEDVCNREQYWINKLKPDINIIRNVAKY